MAELEGGSYPAMRDGSARASSFTVSERLESSNPFDSIELVESPPPSPTIKYETAPPRSKSLWSLYPWKVIPEVIPPAGD